jgi:hypothetical protein
MKPTGGIRPKAFSAKIDGGSDTISHHSLAAALTLALTIGTPALAQPPLAPPDRPVMTRDAEGHATVRAVRLSQPLRIDGRLDDEIYQAIPPITDFIQTLPKNNSEPTERTEAWVMFDGEYLYAAARCWDSAPPDKWTANEMRRDANQIRQNDHFGVLLDTFHDRRNGYVFYANPLGGRIDLTEADEGNSNADWNPVWDVRTGRFEGGWTIEMAIPFKSLRYVSGVDQVWGIQIRRAIRRKNEFDYLNPLPASMGGAQGFFRISAAATLVGLDLPPASRNIEIKPYAISRLTTDRLAIPGLDNHPEGDLGGDAKYGVTANLTADVTVNTDFAQVEVDEQQVNLTRFNLVFPEKREFFLENRGVFTFAPVPTTGTNAGAASTTSDTPSLFYSRRIGLNSGRVIPIDVGARLSGKAHGYGIGVMNIESGDEKTSNTPATNFTVLRLKRDIFRRSSIGTMFTNRSVSAAAPGSNQAYGVDTTMSFFQNVIVNGYYARSESPGVKKENDSYQGHAEYAADRYGALLDYLKVGDNFNPEVGFVRRDNFKRTVASARFSPRPASIKQVRQFTWQGSLEYFLNGAGSLESRQQTGLFSAEFENSDRLSASVNRNYELLVLPFKIPGGSTVATGGYDFSDVQLSYALGQQRRVSGTLALQDGHFYNGDILAASYSSARISVLKQWSAEPTISINRVRLPSGDFTTSLLRLRSDYAFSPRRFVSALVQYSSADNSFSSNFRFRWEYLPGSELFVVYTDERDTIVAGFPGLKNRAFVVKINRLMRF